MKAMNANIGDPIADMLTRIRNANALRYDEVSMPHLSLIHISEPTRPY